MEKEHVLQDLQVILDELREKCPWDKKQTIHSLRQQTIEECHELADAISSDDWNGLKEELGDLLLHVLFYTKIANEQKQFNLSDVIQGIVNKLIRRHPHIYGDVVVENQDDVKRNWESLKLKEGKTSVLSGVPRSLPSMVQAMRIQDKVKQVGFDWEHKAQVWDKVLEELTEVKEAVEMHETSKGSNEKVEEELGDLLFSIINYARFLKIDPDQALARTNKKFMSRFIAMEDIVRSTGKSLTDLDLNQMDEIWEEVKKAGRQD